MQQATNALARPSDSFAPLRWRNEQSLLATSVQNRHPARVAVLHCHFWPLFVCMQPARVRPVTRPLSSVIPPVIGHAALLLALLSIALIQRSHAVSANVRGVSRRRRRSRR